MEKSDNLISLPNIVQESLTDYEKVEIKDFENIYFVGDKESKLDLSYEDFISNKGVFLDDKKRYRISLNDHLNYRYEILTQLGKGAYGNVVKVFDHKENEFRAIKIFKYFYYYTEKRNQELFNVELDCLNKLKELDDESKNYFVTHLENFKFRSHNFVVFRLHGKNLAKDRYKVYNSSPDNKLTIIRDMFSGLEFLAKNKIIHCDLKPENILFKNGEKDCFNVLICDFGLSKILGPNEEFIQPGELLQTRWYRSPEVFFKIPFDEKIDIWSAGCIIYELIEDKPMFKFNKDKELLIFHHYILGTPSQDFIHKYSSCKCHYTSINRCGKSGLIRPKLIRVQEKPYIPGNGKDRLDKFFEQNLENYENKVNYHLIRLVYLCLDYDPDTRISATKALEFMANHL